MERKWWTLLAACVATFMLLLDITVVNVALPDIQRDLDASLSSLQWVVDAYALTLAAFLLMTGSLGDRLERRRVFNFGFGVFTLASFLCGIAGDATLLNLARGVQGSARRRCSRLARPNRAGVRRQGAGDCDRRLGCDGGRRGRRRPLIGGLLTEGFGWEWIFFANIPIGIGAMILTATKLANVTATEDVPLDWAGLFTFSGVCSCSYSG